MIRFTSTLEAFDFNHWSYHIPVPMEIANQMMENNNRRVLIKLGYLESIPMALMKAKAYWYILVNQQIRRELNLETGQAIAVDIEKDHSEYGHEMPEEFQVMLDQDTEGCNYFKSLTPGYQRGLVYIVAKVKNPESRMKKSLAIMHHLKLAKGKLDYKQLNEVIKHYNNL